MAIIDPAEYCMFADIRGVLRKNGPDFPNLPEGIYQMMPINGRRVCIFRNFYDYVITRTEAQQARRSKFASAVEAWQNLSAEQKETWRQKAWGRMMSGYNLYLREYMLYN